MTENNQEYLINRAKIYRDEAQRGIELESQGDIQRATLLWKSLKRACGAELASYEGIDHVYAKFLHTIVEYLETNSDVMAGLELVRVSSRDYLKVTGDKL